MKYIKYLLLSLLCVSVYAKTDLTIGTLSNDPPFEFLNEKDSLSGFDINLMTAICKRIKRECHFKIYTFHELFTALERGQIDLAIGAILITTEQEKRFLFSIPYKISVHQYLTLADSKIDLMKQLQGKTLGIYHSHSDDELAHKQFHHNVKIKPYPHVNLMMDALKKKQVDAIMLEYHRAVYWLSNATGFKLLGGPFTSGEGYGIVTKKGRDKLMQQINQAIIDMENDGTYLKIYQLYF